MLGPQEISNVKTLIEMDFGNFINIMVRIVWNMCTLFKTVLTLDTTSPYCLIFVSNDSLNYFCVLGQLFCLSSSRVSRCIFRYIVVVLYHDNRDTHNKFLKLSDFSENTR